MLGVTAAEPGAIAQHALVVFDAARLLDGDGLLLAEMGEDERWYTSEGLPCSGLALPAPRLEPAVAQADRDAARRQADSLWMDGASDVPAQLALSQQIRCWRQRSDRHTRTGRPWFSGRVDGTWSSVVSITSS